MSRPLLLLCLLAAAVPAAAAAPPPPAALPSPLVTERTPARGLETAVFAGGCFWGVQGVFSHVRGVVRATSGYSGGAAATARYPLVSTGLTGHAEAVEVVFDPRAVSYAELLRIFFSVALDPTEVGRQGPDAGSQYRSVLFVAGPEQRRVAAAYLAQLGAAHLFARPIATEVEPFADFYPAEAHHQDFLARHPDHPYIEAFDMPKLEALKARFPERWRALPVRGG